VKTPKPANQINYQTVIGPSKDFKLLEDAERFFDNKVVAIVGGAGSIGSNVAKILLEKTKATLWLLDSDESRLHTMRMELQVLGNQSLNSLVFDIKDKFSVEEYLSKISPDLIIHAAALKHVPVLEEQPRDGFMTNVIGLRNVLSYVRLNPKTSLCFISTDKAANPVNILGKTKLLGEYMVAGLVEEDRKLGIKRTHPIVRFGNVFMSRGSVIETFIYQLKTGKKITITDPNMERFFMDIKEASELILYSILNELNGVSILKMGTPVRILEVAQRIADLMGIVDFETVEIGSKKGEKISEDLFSDWESRHLVEHGPILNSLSYGYIPFESLNKPLPKNNIEAFDLIESLLRHEVVKLQ
jgi:FlaA1/EpsC-like NDP-sugar epimerase